VVLFGDSTDCRGRCFHADLVGSGGTGSHVESMGGYLGVTAGLLLERCPNLVEWMTGVTGLKDVVDVEDTCLASSSLGCWQELCCRSILLCKYDDGQRFFELYATASCSLQWWVLREQRHERGPGLGLWDTHVADRNAAAKIFTQGTFHVSYCWMSHQHHRDHVD